MLVRVQSSEWCSVTNDPDTRLSLHREHCPVSPLSTPGWGSGNYSVKLSRHCVLKLNWAISCSYQLVYKYVCFYVRVGKYHWWVVEFILSLCDVNFENFIHIPLLAKKTYKESPRGAASGLSRCPFFGDFLGLSWASITCNWAEILICGCQSLGE